MAHGIADNMLLNILLAFNGDIALAPAMNEDMYLNPSTVKNIEKIKNEGVYIVEPEKGGLACGVEGIGRLASLDRIAKAVENRLINAKDLQGKKFIVTAGPTREYIDSMRFITNKSSGKMGYFIAEQLNERGAEVLLVSGSKILNSSKINTIFTESAERMEEEVLKNFPHFDCLIMAAAVADFKIKEKSKVKIKRKNKISLEFQPTGDILKKVSKIKANHQIVIGFCAEDDDLIENAKLKLKNKRLDLIIANSISADLGPESDFNEVFMIDKSSRIEKIEKDHKQVIAAKIVDKIKQRFFSKKILAKNSRLT
jgi:phosphopantothenoylcysteine decarboxylase/phosphopantothenate--cysteine ligase